MTAHSKNLAIFRRSTQTVDWDQVYTEELVRVYNFYLYRTGDRQLAQDLTGTTFERAWKLRSRYRNDLSSPSTWLFGIARNVFKEHLRHTRRDTRWQAPLSETSAVTSNGDIEEGIDLLDEVVRLRGYLNELPEREQELIAYKYGAGITNRKIAKITGLTESNVGTILHRAVLDLRRKWKQNDG